MRATSSSTFIHPYLAPAELTHHASDRAMLPTLTSHRHLLCGYRSKICMSPRARKRNGSLHRFCELHRQQANENQKRWVRRRVMPGGAVLDANTDAELRHLELEYLASYERLLAATLDDNSTSATSNEVVVPMKDVPDVENEFEGPISEWIDASDQATLATCADLDTIWELLGLDDFASELVLTS